jgi:hypothetical protein
MGAVTALLDVAVESCDFAGFMSSVSHLQSWMKAEAAIVFQSN